MSRNSDTVILYFAQSAKEDLKQNRFSASSIHRKVFAKLHRHTTKTLRATNLPVLHFSEENQKGRNLAERLTNAVAEAFAKGFKNIITVGNDTPDLDVKHLLKAAKILESGRSVLGPSADGGNYLIGVNEASFNEIEFYKALQDANNTHEELRKLLKFSTELEVLTDIDDEKSLNRWLLSFTADFEKVILRKVIMTLCAKGFDSLIDSVRSLDSAPISLQYDRGPPLAA